MAIPDAAISTDIIVGFPGETEEDFQQTIEVVKAARFSICYTYQYSIRPGTPAGEMADQIPKDVVQERYERLLQVVNQVAWEENKQQIGKQVEVLVANGEGRKDADTNRLSGRARDNRLVHFEVPDSEAKPRPGDVVTVTVSQAAPYHLIADGGSYQVRRTAGGDAYERRELESCGVPPVGSGKVSLGLSVKVASDF
jgi:tRNA-2-methylthio-N6-dimethylallyladenosine synthase